MGQLFALGAAIAIGALWAGYGLQSLRARLRMNHAQKTAKQVLDDAHREADTLIREAKIQAKDEVLRARDAFEEEARTRRKEMVAQEERAAQREANLDRKLALLDKKEQTLDDKLNEIAHQKEMVQNRITELNERISTINQRLQEIGGMSQEDARQLLLERLEDDLQNEAGIRIRHVQEETTLNAEREARKIITQAIERYAADQVNDITTSTVTLPSDEMKGRIIGKEGRNIRSLEAATGVNFMIDDTPEVVVISGFDPVRREVAKLALEQLIADGRINPARIEEVVQKVQSELDDTIREAGEAAIYELSLRSVAPEVVRTLGRLKFRHSYSQNVLKHSIEVGHLMGMMASELGLDPMVAKRIGLFHDIGKALDHQIEGSHAIIGADLLKRHGETQIVYNAVAAHHGEVEGESYYAPLVTAADAMTASRPGARSETTELYVQRLEKLEEISRQFRGVIKSFAIQAGRELRVLVEPSKIDDAEAMQMARNISKQIEQELQYPGQIKVTVVRETRCVEYAK
jgi:ribonucrease Y